MAVDEQGPVRAVEGGWPRRHQPRRHDGDVERARVQRGLWRRRRRHAHALSRTRHGGLRRSQAAGGRGRQGVLLFERHGGDAVAPLAGRDRRQGQGAGVAAHRAVRAARHAQRGARDRRSRAPSSARPTSTRRRATGRASASSCCRTGCGTATRSCRPASSTGCGSRHRPRKSTARGSCGSRHRATRRTPAPASRPACPRTPTGWKAMTDRRSPSFPRSNWWWCGSA